MRRILVGIAIAGGCGDAAAPAHDARAADAATAPAADAAAPGPDAASGPAPVIPVVVIGSRPHQTDAFTEGLVHAGGWLYESTGLYGGSSLRRIDPATGTVAQSVALDRSLFGEGLALVGDQLIQLTYRERKALRWTVATLAPAGEFSFSGEGWGLTYDGARLIMSDGSSTLFLRDPSTFAVTGTLPVTRDGVPLANLNELEWGRGRIYANVWRTSWIVRIDPASGAVEAVYDAGALPETRLPDRESVLNGIAYLPATDHFLITGKSWPTLYEVDLPAAPR